MTDEVHVYFLDALDYRPLDPPLVLRDAKPWVQKAAPALLVCRAGQHPPPNARQTNPTVFHPVGHSTPTYATPPHPRCPPAPPPCL